MVKETSEKVLGLERFQCIQLFCCFDVSNRLPHLTYVWVLTCSKRDLSVKLTSRGVQWGLYKHFLDIFEVSRAPMLLFF